MREGSEGPGAFADEKRVSERSLAGLRPWEGEGGGNDGR